MFRNTEELRQLIRQGKTNEEIIESQLAYLNSAEYRKEKMDTVKIPGTDVIVFHEGYITPDMKVAFTGDRVNDTMYYFDDKEIYGIAIDIIRANMDKKGFSMNYLIRMVRDYFALGDNSPYKELIDFYKKELPNEPYFFRNNLLYILSSYRCSKFEGSLIDYGKMYLYNILYSNYHNEKHRELSELYRSSMDWEKYEEQDDLVLNLSELKGAGIAACTEHAMLEQNVLSFMGYDTYMLIGNITKNNGEPECHHFNVIKRKNGTYEIVDSALVAKQELSEIFSSEDLIEGIQNVNVINGFHQNISYTSGVPKKNGIKR